MANWLSGKKTYILAGLMVLIGLVHLFTGDITLTDFLNSSDLLVVLNGFAFMALRAGIKKS